MAESWRSAPLAQAAEPSWKAAPVVGEGDKTSLDESTSRAIVSGLLFGFDDEIAAGLKTGFGIAGDYGKQVAEERAAKKARSDAHPVASTIGEIGGAVATFPVAPVATILKAPAALAKGAPLLSKVGNAI